MMDEEKTEDDDPNLVAPRRTEITALQHMTDVASGSVSGGGENSNNTWDLDDVMAHNPNINEMVQGNKKLILT